MPYVHSNLTVKARNLRKTMTPAEVILWQRLRRGQLNGCRFRRQQPIGPYIVDFYCSALRLVIELDGESHAGEEKALYDAERQLFLEKQGITVLCFQNEQVYRSEEGVWQEILKRCEQQNAPSPNPSREGRGISSHK